MPVQEEYLAVRRPLVAQKCSAEPEGRPSGVLRLASSLHDDTHRLGIRRAPRFRTGSEAPRGELLWHTRNSRVTVSGYGSHDLTLKVLMPRNRKWTCAGHQRKLRLVAGCAGIQPRLQIVDVLDARPRDVKRAAAREHDRIIFRQVANGIADPQASCPVHVTDEQQVIARGIHAKRIRVGRALQLPIDDPDRFGLNRHALGRKRDGQTNQQKANQPHRPRLSRHPSWAAQRASLLG